MELGQVIGPHQPYEPDAGVKRLQRCDGLGGIARADPRLDIGDDDAGMIDQRMGRRQTLCQGGRSLGLERIAGADQPPDAIEPKAFERLATDMQMAGMGRIELSAEKANGLACTCNG